MADQTVHLAVYDTLADWEFGYVAAHINSPQFQKRPGRYQIKTVGETLDPITTMGGLRILPDVALENLDPADSRMLILPGAEIAADGGIDAFAKLAARFLGAGVPVAAICGATAALARNGLLDDVQHTSNAPEFLEATGYKGAVHYRNESAVTSGNIITASGVAPISFAVEVFRELDLYSDFTLAAWRKIYEDHNPEGYYELMTEHGA